MQDLSMPLAAEATPVTARAVATVTFIVTDLLLVMCSVVMSN